MFGLRIILSDERSMNGVIGFRSRLNAWRRGFLSSSWMALGLDDRSASEYMPDFAQLLFEKRLNANYAVFEDKILFAAAFGGMLRIPRNLCLVCNGKVVPLPDGVELGVQDMEGLLGFCDARGRMFWKPTHGNGGRGAVLIESTGEGEYTINERRVSADEIVRLSQARQDYLVCEAVQQAAYSQQIFSRSANTLRVRTMIDPIDGCSFVAAAVHRFGSMKSAPVDNWAAGGLSAPIDLTTGRLGKACFKPKGGRLEWVEAHPDTGAQIEGVVVPGWEEIVRSLNRATEMYPGVTGSGWDVVVEDEGFTVLEGNNFPTLPMLQLDSGLLRDARVRRYYVYHEVLRR